MSKKERKLAMRQQKNKAMRVRCRTWAVALHLTTHTLALPPTNYIHGGKMRSLRMTRRMSGVDTSWTTQSTPRSTETRVVSALEDCTEAHRFSPGLTASFETDLRTERSGGSSREQRGSL
eukprot:1504739-Pleurochrysis_carterae.AAC.2